jgi:hypothetical protein
MFSSSCNSLVGRNTHFSLGVAYDRCKPSTSCILKTEGAPSHMQTGIFMWNNLPNGRKFFFLSLRPHSLIEIEPYDGKMSRD